MDIEYLLLLQSFRTATGDLLTPLMELITGLAASSLLIGLVAFVYWAVNKPLGSFLMLNYTGSTLLNQTVKLGACVYRPWIRDSRVLPVESAIPDATGYSFPSGHSQSATAYYGSIGLWFGKKHRWVAWAMAALILLTGFSRNYLGVHTPQDVAVGIGLCCLYLFLNAKLMAWLERNPKGDWIVACAGAGLAVAAVIFFLTKSYPLDYQNGVLLVDPEVMMEDGFKAAGMVAGFFPGWLVERRFIGFSTEKADRSPAQYLLAAAALGPMLAIYKILPGLLSPALGICWAEFISCGLLALYVMALIPALIRMIQQRQK